MDKYSFFYCFSKFDNCEPKLHNYADSTPALIHTRKYARFFMVNCNCLDLKLATGSERTRQPYSPISPVLLSSRLQALQPRFISIISQSRIIFHSVAISNHISAIFGVKLSPCWNYIGTMLELHWDYIGMRWRYNIFLNCII